MRQVLCPVLIGRDQETQVLVDAVSRARQGMGSASFVSGEAGVGKSRLVREVARRAAEDGMLVMTGRAISGGVPAAYRPLTEAVMGALRHDDRPELPEAAELAPFRAALGRLVPQWLPREPGPDVAPVVLGEALLRLLRVLAGGRGCLLVLEDLHWADPESLAVLEFLTDNLGAEAIACVGTVRADAQGIGRTMVRAVGARRAARVIELGRLGDEAAVGMARACLDTPSLPAEVETFVRERADGLPFLVEELLAGLVSAKILVERDGCWGATGPLGDTVPPTFADEIGRRLDGLSLDSRAVLHAAAILGRHFDWSLLPLVTGRDEAAVTTALRQAVDAQVLTADGFGFRHALTREAVLSGLLPPERAGLAGRALAAVEQAHPELPGAWCELAAGLAEAAGDDPRASRLLLTAGLRARDAGALATAEATLHQARRLAGDDPTAVVPIDVALTDVLALAGQVDQAFEVGDRLLARLDLVSHLRSGPAELHLRLARAGVAAGRWAVAAEHLAAAGPVSADGLGARLAALEAQVAVGQGRLDDAERLAATALAAAQAAALPDVACEALEVAGRVARQRDLPAAEAAFTRGLEVAAAHGLELWRLRALHELGTVDQLRTESVERLGQARELAVEVGALALVATLDLQIAAGLIKQFRPDEGLAAALASAEASRRLRLSTLPMALVHQAAAHAQCDRVATMEACLAEAMALAPGDLDVEGCAWGHCRATVALRAEDRARALAEMTTGAQILQRSPVTVSPPFLGLRVLLLAVADDPQAQAEVDRVRGSGATRHRLVASLIGYADAVLRGREGHAVQAEATFAAVDAELGPLVAWYQQYARRLVAEAALADGWGEPVAWLREAAAFFAARGEQPIASAGRALLRRAGAPVPRPQDPAVPASLRALGVTSREADVLGLVAEGLTNRELAARLHVSPRTIEKHVASLLVKTGCRRRAQLAGYSARLPG